MSALLRVEGATKRFGNVEALDGVDFEVDAGEVVALVGDNGAGKSTLVKVISGIKPSHEGRVFFDGQEVSLRRPQDAAGLGITTVYQDLALCDNLDVTANLFLGRERVVGGPARVLDGAAMERRARELLDSLRVRTLRSVHTAVGALSGGRRQSVAIARSLLGEPRVVISHNLADVFAVADRVVVLRLGRLEATFDAGDASQEDVVAAITGARA
jgi:D-xylose transport system ATP-binding protein